MNERYWFPRLGALVAAAAMVVAPSAARAGTFDGRWVFVQRMTTSASVPVVGDIEATTSVISLHDLEDADGRLRGEGKLCRITIDSGTDLVETILPKAFRNSLPPPRIDAALEIEDGAVKLRQDKRVVVVGARLGDPEREALPTSSKDSRVFDQDRDDKPGVTIRIGGLVTGDMYVVQRSWTRLDGGYWKDGTFGGRLAFGSEQVVLGSTSPFLGDPPKARPVAHKSWFRLARLADDASCKDARRVGAAYLGE